MRKPEKCPQCGDQNNLGWLNGIDAETDQEYEDLGGLWYCVNCGWGENESIFPKCCVCQQPVKTKDDREFSENQAAHPGVLGELHQACYEKVCQERPETPWEDPISGEVDWEEMEQDLGCGQPEDECGEDYY